jgi:hypothetical protein
MEVDQACVRRQARRGQGVEVEPDVPGGGVRVGGPFLRRDAPQPGAGRAGLRDKLA